MRPWPVCAARLAHGGPRASALAAIAFTLALIGGRAAAEVRLTGAVASDDRFRGRSVSEGRPVASLEIAYESAVGAYAGVTATGVVTQHDGAQFLGVQTYAGYARRLKAGPSLDFGVTHADYTEYYGGDGAAHYTEIYAGVITRRFASHLYYSPSYFGHHIETLYGEIDTAVHPARNWRLSAHAGVLSLLNGPRPQGIRPTQYDWRLGLATMLHGFELELAGSGAGPDPDYYGGAPRNRSGVAVALRRVF